MKSKSFAITIITLAFCTLFIECNYITHNSIKFNKAQWDSAGDLESYPYREDMIEDLTKHHQIKGLTYHQLIDSLGEPENYEDKDSMYYDIVVNFGYLDPKSGRYLAIGLNKDSIATGFKIVDWKNRHANE
jgi:uncharacterized membrane protein